MKAPWYVDVYEQAKVLNRIARGAYGSPQFKDQLTRAQEQLWTKFDVYMMRRGAL